MAVVGRESEQAQLEQTLAAAGDGPCALLLEGEPGIGKSTLWSEGVGGARRSGWTVIVSAPGEHDRDLAFAGLGDLFQDITDELLSELPEPQRRALSGALYLSQDEGTMADADALPRAVLSALRRMARSGRLLLAVDDEQWLDQASRRVLAFALGRLRDEAICILVARRSGGPDLMWPAVRRALADERVVMITVAPLAESATARLIADHQGAPVPRAVVRRIHQASGGNPLYALALAHEVSTPANRDGEKLTIPPTLLQAMARRLDGLGSRALDPLLVASACTEPPLSLIRAVLPDFTTADLDEARARGIVDSVLDRVRFTHPLLASAVYTSAAAQRRREVHRLLAARFEPSHEEHAHHLALGAERPDQRLAIVLEQAADSAAARGAPEVAATLLEHAARLTPIDAIDALRSRRVMCAQRYFESGDQGRARALLESVLADLPHGLVRARALLQLARVRADDFEAATQLAEEALINATDLDRVAAQIETLLTELFSNRGDQPQAVRHARRALARAERLGDPGVLGQTLALVGLSAFFAGEGIQEDLMRRAVALEDQAESVTSYDIPSCKLGCQLLWSDELARARPLLQRALERSVQRGEEYDRDAILFHLAHLEWEAGELAAAHRYTETFTETARQQADEQADAYLGWLRAFIAGRRGDHAETRRRAQEAIHHAERIGDAFIQVFASALLATVELAEGQPGPAHDRLNPLRAALLEQGRGFIGSLTLNLWTTDIEALIAMERLAEAAATLTDLRTRAGASGNPNALALAHRCHGLMSSASGDVDGAMDSMRLALEEHARRPIPIEVGRTLLEKGALEQRSRRKGDAKRSLEQAQRVLQGVGADRFAARADDELRRVGLRRAADPGGFTPAQARVAELVASGLTNREIGTVLYMSVRTVETHLTKIYRELGIRSRAQLVGAMAARAAGGDSPWAPAAPDDRYAQSASPDRKG